jgi:tripartite-type tricarboxylate transporter receptor subunit TctC
MPAPAGAEDWPTRPLTMVIPFAPGGAIDVTGRILGPHISEFLHQPVIIENVVGAGGMVGASRVAKARPDGYQFILGTAGTHAQNQTLYRKPLYDAAADFTPVALVAELPQVLLARKDLPVNSLHEFIAYAKVNQASMQYGSAGAGSGTHLACALLNAAIGISATHVPYRGGAPMMQDLIAGRIDYECPNAVAAVPQLDSRLVKALAILTRDRSPILPDLATAQEQGLKDFAAENWCALFLPKGTAKDIAGRLHDAFAAAIDQPSVSKRLNEIGADVPAPDRRSPEYLNSFVKTEIQKWARTIQAAGVAGQ